MPSTSKPRALTDTISVASTGVAMPLLGFGVYQVPKPACVDVCLAALTAGYRHIDSAQVYENETEVGQAVSQASAKLGISRKEVFLTTKIMSHSDNGGQTMYESVANSVSKIGGRKKDAYVDLFLVHAPGTRQFREDAWKALEKLYEQGRAKTIGVSNFTIEDLEEMKEYATIWPPHVNQIELHPWCQERETVQYCENHRIILQAYSPLDQGNRINDPAVVAIAEKYKKSPAQVLIRYSLQKGWIPLPKSVNLDRMKQNTDVYDFELGSDDMAALDSLEPY